jgi:hypothetical protein
MQGLQLKERPASGQTEVPWLPRLLAYGLLVAATLALLLFMARPFLRDPSRLAPTRDPAWYTWRTQVLLEGGPAALLEKDGPFGMLSRGYRVTTPLLGALLHRIPGVDTYRFTLWMAVGLPVLTSLALAAFAYRHKRDMLAFLLTLTASVPLFTTRPFIGYMDNVFALFFLATALFFLEPSRTSWPARVALGGLAFLATLTHPPTALLFGLVLGAGAGFRWLAYGFSFRRVLQADGPMIFSVLLGLVAGALVWLGLWGPSAPLTGAALTQPYTADFFRARLGEWIRSLRPQFTLPMAALGVAWIGGEFFRRRSVDRHSAVSLLWALPVAGVFGFALGIAFPFYRFLNVTLALMLLVGMGAWALTRFARWLGPRVGDRWRLAQAAAAIVVLAGIAVFLVKPGARTWSRQTPWTSSSMRLTLATARGFASAYPESPIVFVIHPKPVMRSWGLTKQATNILFSGVDGSRVEDAHVFVGTVEDLLVLRPRVTGQPVFDRVSRGFTEDVKGALEATSSPAVAFYLPGLDASDAPPPPGTVAELSPSLAVVQGPGLVPVSGTARRAAYEAERQEGLRITPPPAPPDLLGLGRTVLGLAFLLLVPGLLVMRRLGLDDFPARLALVPAVSLAMSIAAGVCVVAVLRGPFTVATGWITVSVAVGVGLVSTFGLPAVRRWRLRRSR